MDADEQEKNGFLRVERGGLYAVPATAPLSPEAWLEREVQAWGARGQSQRGVYATRAIADISQATRWPHRIPARIIREALEGQASPVWARQFGTLLTEYADRKARAMGLYDWRPDPCGAALRRVG